MENSRPGFPKTTIFVVGAPLVLLEIDSEIPHRVCYIPSTVIYGTQTTCHAALDKANPRSGASLLITNVFVFIIMCITV